MAARPAASSRARSRILFVQWRWGTVRTPSFQERRQLIQVGQVMERDRRDSRLPGRSIEGVWYVTGWWRPPDGRPGRRADRGRQPRGEATAAIASAGGDRDGSHPALGGHHGGTRSRLRPRPLSARHRVLRGWVTRSATARRLRASSDRPAGSGRRDTDPREVPGPCGRVPLARPGAHRSVLGRASRGSPRRGSRGRDGPPAGRPWQAPPTTGRLGRSIQQRVVVELEDRTGRARLVRRRQWPRDARRPAGIARHRSRHDVVLELGGRVGGHDGPDRLDRREGDVRLTLREARTGGARRGRAQVVGWSARIRSATAAAAAGCQTADRSRGGARAGDRWLARPRRPCAEGHGR